MVADAAFFIKLKILPLTASKCNLKQFFEDKWRY